jgi:hypothetical protein
MVCTDPQFTRAPVHFYRERWLYANLNLLHQQRVSVGLPPIVWSLWDVFASVKTRQDVAQSSATFGQFLPFNVFESSVLSVHENDLLAPLAEAGVPPRIQ